MFAEETTQKCSGLNLRPDKFASCSEGFKNAFNVAPYLEITEMCNNSAAVVSPFTLSFEQRDLQLCLALKAGY